MKKKMNVYLNVTYTDGTVKIVRVRQTPDWDTFKVVLSHYRSKPHVEKVYMDVC